MDKELFDKVDLALSMAIGLSTQVSELKVSNPELSLEYLDAGTPYQLCVEAQRALRKRYYLNK